MRGVGVAAVLAASGAMAGPFDGLYVPHRQLGGSWNCVYNGREAGAVWIEDDVYHDIENPLCRLTNPVAVRDMPAVLYDLVCEGYGEPHFERVMFVRQPYGMFEIRAGRMVDWEQCVGE
jgi:hypothetical protein